MDLRNSIIKTLKGQWDRVAAWIAFALAVLLLLLGYRGVDDAVYTAQQIPYLISGGLGALLLCAIGATMWISADLRDEWRKLDEIHEEIRSGRGLPSAATTVDPTHVQAAPADHDGSAPERPKRVLRAGT